MKSSSQKAILRQYYFKCILILICYIAIVIPCIFVYPNVWSILFCTALYFPVKLLIRIVANKTIASVLFVKLDAIGFQELIKGKFFIPPLDYRINAAMCTGDYQTTVNIATTQMRKKKSSIMGKYSYLGILALIYFELRDFEKLQILLKKYDEYKENYPSKSFLSSSNSVWSYYRYFLDKNYEACKIVCKERNLGLKPNVWYIKLRKLQNDFFYAIACYENGDFKEAKSFFENIISIAPRMDYATLSKKYLMAIEQEQPVSLFDVEVLPDTNFQIYDNKTEKRIKKSKLVKRIGIVIVVVFSVVGCFLNVKNDSDISDFEKKLSRAVTLHYEDAIILDYFNLYKDEIFVDSLGLIVENNCIHLVEIVFSDNSQTVDILSIEEDLDLGEYYCLKSPVSEYYLGFVLTQSEIADADAYRVRELKVNNNKYLFFVDYIEIVPKTTNK